MKLIAFVAVVAISTNFVLSTTVVFGPQTSGADDERSSVSCPPGKMLVKCECDNFRNCDGTALNTNLVCSAIQRWHSPAVKAKATCADIKVTSSPKGWTTHPTAVCPCGFSVIECALNNPWTQNPGQGSPIARKEGNKCVTVNTCSNCQATALCIDQT